jgi:hypothetical protein
METACEKHGEEKAVKGGENVRENIGLMLQFHSTEGRKVSD